MSDTQKGGITVIALFVVPLVLCLIILVAARDEAPNAAAVPVANAVATESRNAQDAPQTRHDTGRSLRSATCPHGAIIGTSEDEQRLASLERSVCMAGN